MLYVKVKLETAINRNANRERVVPVNVILEKFETIETAFEIIENYVDVVTIANND